MRVDSKSQLIAGVTFLPSPNCDDRPKDCSISLVVLHNISLPPQQFAGENVERLFTNCLDFNEHPFYREIEGLQVSSHLYIRRNGQLIQFVPFHKRAWHAGQSNFQGRQKCNDFSIGIELEGADTLPFTEAQYSVLIPLLRCLLITYSSLCSDAIVGHSDIAPGRKTDPGECFDWDLVRQQLA